MSDKQKLLERARKLLEMAQRGTEEEAAIASQKLQQMMTRHNLSMSDVEQASNPIQMEFSKNNSKRADSWRGWIAMGVARTNYCECFWRDVNGEKAIAFIGRQHNAVIATLLYEYLVETALRLADEGVKQEKRRYQTYLEQWDDVWGDKLQPPNYIVWKNDFLRGCSLRLQKRLINKFEQIMKEGISSGSDDSTGEEGLIPAFSALACRTYAQNERKAIDRWMKEQNIQLGRGGKARFAANRDGFKAGTQAGDSVSLDAQLRGRGQRSLKG